MRILLSGCSLNPFLGRLLHPPFIRSYGACQVQSFSSGFLTVLQKASPATQQLMALENKFIAMFPFNRKLIAMSRSPTLARKLLISENDNNKEN